MFSADLGVNQVASNPPATDPPFQKVALLLHGDGTNGAQNNTFVDSSTNNFTITRTGNVAQGTFSPFSVADGQWSNYFDGAGDYLSIASNSSFGFGTGAFTVEMWINPQVQITGASNSICLVVGNTSGALQIGGKSSTEWGLCSYGVAWRLVATTFPTLNTWNHIAVVRDGSSNTAIFLNGTRVASGTVTASFPNSAMQFGGGNYSFVAYYTGYISNLRSASTNIYDPTQTSITVPTTSLTAVTNTTFLTCQSNRFVDNSSNNFTITPAGNTKVTAFSPFAPSAAYSASTNGGSGYFDGSGDYLTAPNNSAFDLSTGDFTVEMWFYSNIANSSYQRIYGCNTASGIDKETIAFEISASGLYIICVSGTTFYGAVTPVATKPNQWYHLALVRNGTTVTGYINGVSVGSSTLSGSVNNPTGAFPQVGAWQASGSYSRYINGYISDLRIVKGTAVYTANFTPPTSPLTAISGTSLLLNCTNAGIIDNAGKNDIETVGNAQISTSVKKYGTGSMYFDGTGDWLYLADRPELQLGTGNFTIEGWLYLGATGASRGIVGKGTSTTGWLLSTNSSNQVVFTYGSSTITSTGTLSGSTWYHIAVCREGTGTNQTKIYINGSNDGTGTVSTNFNQTNVMYVGADRTGGSAMNGYIDDLRITLGQALYTSNFTPPTQAFPNV